MTPAPDSVNHPEDAACNRPRCVAASTAGNRRRIFVQNSQEQPRMTRHRVSPLDLLGACLWLDMEAHRKLVLLSLCENADTHGLCYPGREYIAMRASVSPRNASTHLQALEDDGYVAIVHRGRGPGQTTIRRLNLDRIVAEGRSRQDSFSRERERPPLFALLDQARDGADSAPSQNESQTPTGDGADSAPINVIFPTRERDLFDTENVIFSTPRTGSLRHGERDPSRLRNRPAEPASRTGQRNRPAEGETATPGAREKINSRVRLT